MRNRYTGERELPTIVPCPVPVMKGSLNLEILIESVDGVRMEDLNFTLRFYTWGSALKFSLGKEQLYKAKGRYYARLNERDFRNGWLMCDVEIRESNEGDCGCFVKPLLLRCNTGLILNGGSNSPCPTDSYHEGWMNGYKVQFRLADVLPLPDIEIPDKAIAEVIDSMKNANVLGYFTHESLLKEQEVASVAFVGDVKDAHPYFYYVPGTEPDGYQPGWNDMSAVLGTYDLTADQISIYDFHLLTEYNVSHNHVHTTRVFSTDWGVTTRYYKEFPDWTEGKTYTACSKVNMAGYTEHSFMANRDTKEAPFKVVEDTNEFSFEEAIVLVPKEYRFPGMKVTFINSMTHLAETWYFKGGTWENVGNWQKIDFGVGEDQITAEEVFREKFEMMKLTADRAIADEHGNRIPDTYVRREAVANYIKSIYQELFITYPPNIMEGYITPEMLSEAVKDMLAASGATITNLPDEEDLSTIHGVLKFANKRYNPGAYSGLGRQYLRKNLVGGQNLLVQSMMQRPNTIYIVQYDYDLNGGTLTIPEGCTLDFQGGSFKNGQIDGNGCTLLNYPNYNIFNDVLISNFNIDYLDVRWFDAIEGQDATDAFQYCVNSFNKNVGIPINVVGHYVLTRTIQCDCGIMMFNNAMFNFTMDEDRMVEGTKIRKVAQINVNLDEGYDCVFSTNVYYSPGKDASLCVKGIDFTNVKYKPEFAKLAADGEKTKGYFIEQEYIKNNSPYKEVLFHYAGGGRPTYGFKFENSKFDSFEKAIYFSGAGTSSGSVAYNINIDFCEFRNCNYAVYAKQVNEGNGTATFAGFQFTRNRLQAPCKIYVDGVYGACSYKDSVIEGFYQEGDILNNATYPIIYNSISNGGIEIGGMYLESNAGNFVFEGLDNSAETSQVYDVAKTAHASLSFKDSKSSIYGLAESSITRHLYIKCKDLTIKDIPTQSVPYVFKFDNCTLEESVISNSSMRPLYVSNIVLNETSKGNKIGSACIKTRNYTTLNLNNAINKRFAYYFTPESGFTSKSTIGFEGTINRYYGQQEAMIAPLKFYNDFMVAINDNRLCFVFYKTIVACKIEFLGDLLGDDYEIIDEYNCVSAEGFTVIRTEFANDVQKRIKSVRISKYTGSANSRYYISDIVALDLKDKSFTGDAPSLKDACVLLNTEDIQYISISSLSTGVGSNVLYVNSPIWNNGQTWVDGLGRIYDKKRGATKDRPDVINSNGYTYFDTTIGKPVFFKNGTTPTCKITIDSSITISAKGSLTATITFETAICRATIYADTNSQLVLSAENIAQHLYEKVKKKFDNATIEGASIIIPGQCYGNHTATFNATNNCTASIEQVSAGSAVWVDATGVEV